MRIFIALPIVFAGSRAICGDQVWGASSLPSGFVGGDYTHDDGGALVIFCDTSKKLVAYLYVDPRVHWQEGAAVSLMTRADNGSQSGPSKAVAVGPTKLIVGEQSTWDINVMAKASTNFAMGDGAYARIFPTANLKKAVEPVLRACGDGF
jgi:hypothetical protein